MYFNLSGTCPIGVNKRRRNVSYNAVGFRDAVIPFFWTILDCCHISSQ